MWPFKKQGRYEAVAGEDEEHSLSTLPRTPRPVIVVDTGIPEGRRRILLPLAGFALILVLGILAALLFDLRGHLRALLKHEQETEGPANATLSESACPLRREWRTLSPPEQIDYITSVRCLLTLPSVLHPNTTRYDDYPWIHSHVGWHTHHSAPFLPWHRYFLHIYETTLRAECGYTGALVYWDWTLDSADLPHAPVFASDGTGFGGDGQRDGAITVGTSGRCVVDGPFADIHAEYYDTKRLPHCLSRGFHDDTGALGVIDGHDISPASIDEVLQSADYESFVALLESRVHDAIPFGVGGDFETFSAPYDPLFFLHHTQLDRLWWLWQQRSPDTRLSEYSGHKHRHSIEMAGLDDEINMQDFAPPVRVEQVMDIGDDFLCYRY